MPPAFTAWPELTAMGGLFNAILAIFGIIALALALLLIALFLFSEWAELIAAFKTRNTRGE
jgi:hypothetical protein